jgi:hypothetical protein
MRRKTILSLRARIVLCVSLFLSATASAGNRISEWYNASAKHITPATVTLFESVSIQSAKNSDFRVNTLELDQNQFSSISVNKPALVNIALPNGSETINLNLARVNVTSSDFTVTTENGGVNYSDGIHYRGIVNNDPNSIASFSVFGNEVMGFYSGSDGSFTLGKLADGSGDYGIYNTSELPALSSWGCQEMQAQGSYASSPSYKTTGIGCKTVNVYFECDYKLFTDKGSSTANVANYVTSMFNQVSTLYANENIAIQISQINIWTVQDPYAGYATASDVLTPFRLNHGTNYNGDIAHFLSTRSLGGGVAYVGTLCNKAYSYGVSQIYNTYSNVPTYSWTVEVVSHELGHNLGSPHTQSCSWPGGAIDNCYMPEGGCAYGPAPVNGGTVMSYCHLTSTGINFNNGFGQLPGDKIRSAVLNASCLASSGTAPAGLTTSNITSGSADLNWVGVTGATQYNVEYKLSSSTSWTFAGSTSNTSITVNGLNANSVYQWHVSSDCSAFSSAASFTTLPGTITGCSAPSILSASNIASNAATLSWDAIPGANNYTVEYQVAGSASWVSVAAILSNSVNVSSLSAGTIYNWRVKADCSVFSTSSSFTTQSVVISGCGAPSNLNHLNLLSTSVTLSWSPVQGAQSYNIKFHKVGQNNWSNLNNTVGTSRNVSGLIPGASYEWKISTKCSGTSSNFSSVITFTTPANMMGGNGTEISLYPNPATDQLSVDLNSLTTVEGIIAEIYNLQGSVMKLTNLTSGHNTISLDGISNGLYLLQVKQPGKETITLKFVKSAK